MKYIHTITKHLLYFFLILTIHACHSPVKQQEFAGAEGEVKLITVAPGHFHAALLQKTALKQLNPNVQVYAPQGAEVEAHLALIESYNARKEDPTHWNEQVYLGDDFMEKMLADKQGNVVILAGNNRLKTDYIFQSVDAGLNVLADKPMAIDGRSFQKLKNAFTVAAQKDALLYDIMTERYNFINVVSRAIIQEKDLFGEIQKGTPSEPSVELESIHHFYKTVSGKPLIRPAWYYDVEQQGEGIVDVTIHLIDLIHWKCLPGISLDYEKDIRVTDATHWPTRLTLAEFGRSTGRDTYPDYLNKYVKDDSLFVYSNGTIHYTVKDINVGIRVVWNYEAPEGAGDIHRTIMKGTNATLLILQGKEQGYVTKLYIKKNDSVSDADFQAKLDKAIRKLQTSYSISTKPAYDGMIEIEISPDMKDGHEAHFSKVAEKYFGFLVSRDMPEWEVPNMLAKYYITTTALEIAKKKD